MTWLSIPLYGFPNMQLHDPPPLPRWNFQFHCMDSVLYKVLEHEKTYSFFQFHCMDSAVLSVLWGLAVIGTFNSIVWIRKCCASSAVLNISFQFHCMDSLSSICSTGASSNRSLFQFHCMDSYVLLKPTTPCLTHQLSIPLYGFFLFSPLPSPPRLTLFQFHCMDSFAVLAEGVARARAVFQFHCMDSGG